MWMKSFKDLQLTKKNDGSPLKKREIGLIDNSVTVPVVLQIFGDQINEVPYAENLESTFKRLKISEFGKKKMLLFTKESTVVTGAKSAEKINLSTNHTIETSPTNELPKIRAIEKSPTKQLPETQAIETSPFKPPITLSVREAIEQYESNGIAYLRISGTIKNIQSSGAIFYKECPKIGCSEKVDEIQEKEFFCRKCSKKYSVYKHNVILKMTVLLNRKLYEISSLNEASLQLLNIDSSEFAFLANNMENISSKFKKIEGEKFMFTIKFYTDLVKNKMALIAEEIASFGETGTLSEKKRSNIDKDTTKRRKN